MAIRAPSSDRDQKRARILEAAREVCARRGFAAARMEEVAGEARVSKGTLYHFFPSKEALFEAALLEAHAEGMRSVRAALAGDTPPRARLARLRTAMAELLPVIAEQMTVNLQLWGVVAGDPAARERTSRALAGLYAEIGAPLRRLLEAGRQSGDFREDADVGAYVSAILALFDGFVYRSTFDRVSGGGLAAAFDALACQGLLERREADASRQDRHA